MLLESELASSMMAEVNRFIAKAKFAGKKITYSQLSKAAATDNALINRVLRQKGTITLSKYCDVISYVRTHDPREPLPGIDVPHGPIQQAAE